MIKTKLEDCVDLFREIANLDIAINDVRKRIDTLSMSPQAEHNAEMGVLRSLPDSIVEDNAEAVEIWTLKRRLGMLKVRRAQAGVLAMRLEAHICKQADPTLRVALEMIYLQGKALDQTAKQLKMRTDELKKRVKAVFVEENALS